jgi:KDO2-lipid IV(A) lauroyltransferase
MANAPGTTIAQARRSARRFNRAIIGASVVGLIRILHLIPPSWLANAASWTMRMVGPLLRENRTARENLVAAFPEKSAAEIDRILRGSWDNLGRLGAEFIHLDRILGEEVVHSKSGRLDIPALAIDRFVELANDGKPALIFCAHLANWELPAVVAAKFGLPAAALYRRPNIAAIDRWLLDTRASKMGELISTSLDAPMKLADALSRGLHVGMLVDQYYVRGVEVTFFGRRTMANPLIARLARHFDCPIVGVRIIRLPNERFTGAITAPLKPPRDAEGKIDVQETMQMIMSIIEGWIREHPEQWLWQHRRWRPEDMKKKRSLRSRANGRS